MLFNIYLEQALLSVPRLKNLMKRGDLKAFADDLLLHTANPSECSKVIQDIKCLEKEWHLQLNIKKSVILTQNNNQEI